MYWKISYFDPSSFEYANHSNYSDFEFIRNFLKQNKSQFNIGDQLVELMAFFREIFIERLADKLHSASYEENLNGELYKILTDKYFIGSACEDFIICCIKVLHQYQFHTSVYKSLYIAHKYTLTLACTQVSCKQTFRS